MLTPKEIGCIMRRMKDYPPNCGQRWMIPEDMNVIDTERLIKANPDFCMRHG
jgi:hypothetical protein